MRRGGEVGLGRKEHFLRCGWLEGGICGIDTAELVVLSLGRQGGSHFMSLIFFMMCVRISAESKVSSLRLEELEVVKMESWKLHTEREYRRSIWQSLVCMRNVRHKEKSSLVWGSGTVALGIQFRPTPRSARLSNMLL